MNNRTLVLSVIIGLIGALAGMQALRLLRPTASLSTFRQTVGTSYARMLYSQNSASGSDNIEGTKSERLPNPENDQASSQPLGLPEPPREGSIQLDVSTGESVSLDALGPMVVNKDGSISRISNWDKMAAIEKENTLRIVGKRNKQRLEALKNAEDEKA